MAQGTICVCPQCGKKYKLKEGFAAESFACKACGATVWVAGKPKAPSARSGTRRSAARGKARGRGAAAKTRGGKRAPTRTRRGAAAADTGDEERPGRGRYQRPQDKTGVIIVAVGGVLVLAIVLYFVLAGKKDEAKTNETTASVPTDPMDLPDEPGEHETPGIQANPIIPESTPEPTGDGAPAEGKIDDTQEASTEPAKKLGGGTVERGGIRLSRYDPPPDLGHLEDTPPDLRKKIDEFVELMFDQYAGRDSLDAKNKLIAIGKPAFPVILGRMARVRDSITDVDSPEERMLESSLKLADEALREMDGYLTANEKSTLRPGSEKKYIAYICRLHYKRWVKVLSEMPEMPGPFDASKFYGDEEKPEEYDGK